MKKIIFIASLFLCSCTEYKYVVEVEKCNGKKDTVSFNARDIYIGYKDGGVPILVIHEGNRSNIINVCGYITLSKTEVK